MHSTPMPISPDATARHTKILVVDDDAAVAKVLAGLLSVRGYDVETIDTGERALERLAAAPVDLLITDLRMPGIDGMELLRRARGLISELPVIVITAHGTTAAAVEALRLGAVDFLSKPFDGAEIAFVVPKALATIPRSIDAPMPVDPDGEPLGQSEKMRAVAERVRLAARGNATVLVRGETGVGKERVAHAIHRASARRDKPLIVVHCGAYPEALLESELFGYEKGAFTGAVSAKPGRLELADGGTIFLDEVGEISPAVQVKLLRLVVDGVVERIGGTRSRRLDLRWIAATHRPLEQMVRDGRFREDLFYRLDVVPIEVPPLRERADDIDRLVDPFWRRECAAYGYARALLDPEARAMLRSHPWPGNVRQLENFIRRLAALSDDRVVSRADVERELGPRGPTPIGTPAPEGATSLDHARDSAERAALLDAATRASGDRKRMAAILGVSLRKLYYMLRAHQVD